MQVSTAFLEKTAEFRLWKSTAELRCVVQEWARYGTKLTYAVAVIADAVFVLGGSCSSRLVEDISLNWTIDQIYLLKQDFLPCLDPRQ